MKVVLFCGGQGLRIREAGENIPKPMVPIGYRPIIWHLMRYYAHYGHKDFVLCLGHRGDAIKRYFLDYDECISNDFVLSGGGKSVKLLSSDTDNWTITFVDTGAEANVGQRLRAVRRHLDGEEMFLANYADNLSDVPLDEVIAHARREDKLATCVSVRPSQTFHVLRTTPGTSSVCEIEPVTKADVWMNGGFFALKPQIFDHLHEGDELVIECFNRLIGMNQLTTFRHDGFWHAMDTFKEKMALEDLYSRGKAPWEVWRGDRAKAQPVAQRV
ncbi:MAG TPA: sugar phosphate nucleotidyltransferase [Tepidisphaeraceae bacterium]|nr:sugar phosphate nucleotidyltransferase [Tepidisphaeraceae bacterium]